MSRDKKKPLRDRADLPLPRQPIDRVLQPLLRFMQIKATSGMVLAFCTAIALLAANSTSAESYLAFWETEVTLSFGSYRFQHSLHHVINDGLMAIFFFVIGLEVKREFVIGALANWRYALLPIAAAVGGMLVPAGIYLVIQFGQDGMRGWGIPMATDIAFVVGCLALLGSRVPHSLRVMLLSLAIVDDIGAIIVIAVGYTESLDGKLLAVAAASILIIHLFSRIGVRRFPPYVAVGAIAWLALHESGIHATLTGVILGLMTPAKPVLLPERFQAYLIRKNQLFQSDRWQNRGARAEIVKEFQQYTRETVSPLEYLEVTLHPWTAYIIMPLFALANAGVTIELDKLGDSVAIAVIAGLVVGKPVGIMLASWLVIRTGWARLPDDLPWSMLMAGSCLAGIGFTMALFIGELAFGDDGPEAAKIGVLAGSATSAALGMGLLYWTSSRRPVGEVPRHRAAKLQSRIE